MKALVIDDEFTSRKMLHMLLAEYGNCDLASDGDEGLEAFRSAAKLGTPYDLVCLDIVLPDIDGEDVLTMMREEEEQRAATRAERCKIVMTTALDDKASVLGAFRQQADGYIVKPVSHEQLVETLKRLELL